MTGFTVEWLPNEPILLVTYREDWSMSADLDRLHQAVWQALEEARMPVFYIVDATIETPFTLDDLMVFTRLVLRGSKPILRHPNMREHALVTRNPVLHRAIKVLPLGRSFETLDEALAYVRWTAQRQS